MLNWYNEYFKDQKHKNFIFIYYFRVSRRSELFSACIVLFKCYLLRVPTSNIHLLWVLQRRGMSKKRYSYTDNIVETLWDVTTDTKVEKESTASHITRQPHMNNSNDHIVSEWLALLAFSFVIRRRQQWHMTTSSYFLPRNVYKSFGNACLCCVLYDEDFECCLKNESLKPIFLCPSVRPLDFQNCWTGFQLKFGMCTDVELTGKIIENINTFLFFSYVVLQHDAPFYIRFKKYKIATMEKTVPGERIKNQSNSINFYPTTRIISCPGSIKIGSIVPELQFRYN